MASDGQSLLDSWFKSLHDAESEFRNLLASTSSRDWKRLSASPVAEVPARMTRLPALPEVSDVIVHRRFGKSGDSIFRAVLDIALGDEALNLDTWRAILKTPEMRQIWDPAVDGSHIIEMLDPATRISKTNFTLGWPANPRDAITISKTFYDNSTIIDISTSVPRTKGKFEPAYLRPAPPFVRSNVTCACNLLPVIDEPSHGDIESPVFAWCIQHAPGTVSTDQLAKAVGRERRRNTHTPGRLRVTCFWQHDLSSVWNFGSSNTVSQQLSTMVIGLYRAVQSHGTRIPLLTGCGRGVGIESIKFDIDRHALTILYSIHDEEDLESGQVQNEDRTQAADLHSIRERRRLTRSIECSLTSSEGWDVQVSAKASSKEIEELPWIANADRVVPATGQTEQDTLNFRITHAPLPTQHSTLKVKAVLELSGPSKGIRLNGLPQYIQVIQERDPTPMRNATVHLPSIRQDSGSLTDISANVLPSSVSTDHSHISSSASGSGPLRTADVTENGHIRTAAAGKAISARVRRSYIYFSSLLQEPEAKWRQNTEYRGVSVTQLDSIDPTLIVYRAEATFVGVGIWDLFGALISPGTRNHWDKQYEDAVLLEDVNELTQLWQYKTAPAWPVSGRDSVLLNTVYKSPTAFHFFSFSADDPKLFPSIPSVEPNVIRTQVDLRGWSVEALSPTTTLLTLLEQSDPKGWSNKASIPQQMINAVAGVGEFAIKCGGPPVVTRLTGGKARQIRYDHEKGNFRIEYETAANRRTIAVNASEDAVVATLEPDLRISIPTIECELRCDVDTWASSLDVIIDPPPQNISCLRRHRLSIEGGGMWLTISHDALATQDERILCIVRKGLIVTTKDRGAVMVNGTRVIVDTEELPERDIKTLTKQKRTKPVRVPLDQPPVTNAIRKRRAEWENLEVSNSTTAADETASATTVTLLDSGTLEMRPSASKQLLKMFTGVIEQASTGTQQVVAAMTPATTVIDVAALLENKSPMSCALDALGHTQDLVRMYEPKDWTRVDDKGGLAVDKKLVSSVSTTIPIHRAEKVIQGVAADEIAAVINSYECRQVWDEWFTSARVLQGFGSDCHAAFAVYKGTFPFRERGFFIASLMARSSPPPSLSRRPSGSGEVAANDSRKYIICVSSSFSPDAVPEFSSNKFNPSNLSVGQVFLDAWVLETLDPYSTENYAIPSTRCTRYTAINYAGSMPTAMNLSINYYMTRAILAVEKYVKGMPSLPVSRLPTTGLLCTDNTKSIDRATKSWKTKRRDIQRTLIRSHYVPDERQFDVRFTLRYKPMGSSKLIASSDPLEETVLGTRFMPPSTGSPLKKDMESAEAEVTRHERLRTMSSAFTQKGEFRHSTDLLVAELVIDSKLYPNGYSVSIRSTADNSTGRVALMASAQTSQLLPLTHVIYTMPSSPLHSTSLSNGPPRRHLLRLSLPTAQYKLSTIEDPLTGQIQTPPPKPQWLLDFQSQGAVIDIRVRPLKIPGKMMVTVDGVDTSVLNEKESLTAIGREELLDDRVSKLTVVSRILGEESIDLMPVIAQASDLFFAKTALDTRPSEETVGVVVEQSEGAIVSEVDVTHAVSDQDDNQPTAGSRSFLDLLNTYSTNYFRSPSSSPPANTPLLLSRKSSASSFLNVPGTLASPVIVKNPHSIMASSDLKRTFTVSTVFIIALIAFLIGSLIRSLLSPADFIYLVTDLQEVDTLKGWREVKRLLEIKYIFSGWDLTIALVRRH